MYLWQVCKASLMVAMAAWMSLCSKVIAACMTSMLLYPRAWYMLSFHLHTHTHSQMLLTHTHVQSYQGHTYTSYKHTPYTHILRFY